MKIYVGTTTKCLYCKHYEGNLLEKEKGGVV